MALIEKEGEEGLEGVWGEKNCNNIWHEKDIFS